VVYPRGQSHGGGAVLIQPLPADPFGAAFGMLSRNPSLLAALEDEMGKDARVSPLRYAIPAQYTVRWSSPSRRAR
jgi:hypothetical protein